MILTGFSGLDGATGGLAEGKNYLLYGNIGTGKTTFSLQFAYRGLEQGENVVLVTRRSAQSVFDHAVAFGMDLEPFVHSNQLIIFEYVPTVVENSMRLKDTGDVGREFEAFMGSDTAQRVVFDPITPLLASPTSAISVFRARTIIQSFSDLGATCLYLFDTPEGEDCLAQFKDFVYGVLRFEAGAFQTSRGRIFLERLPELRGPVRQLEFEATPGAGLVEVEPAPQAGAAAEAGGEAAPPRPRTVLLIEPDAAERKILSELLEQTCQIQEAESAADGLAKVAAEAPDLIILERENKGLDGVEICKRLRQNKLNVPIVIIANQIRRARDRVQIMAAGADECLERPVDGRILKLKVQQLLQRYDRSKDRLTAPTLDTTVTTSLERDKTTSTTNLSYFWERVSYEITYSKDNNLSFALVVLRLPDSSPVDPEFANLVGSLIREYDIVCIQQYRIAALLAETDEKGMQVFLNRLAQRWKRTPVPMVQHLTFNRRDDFLQTVKQLLEDAKPSGRQTSGADPARV